MRTQVYLIVMPTGIIDNDGVEAVIIIDVKLSAYAANKVIEKNPGSRFQKMIADKEATT